jgi:hypothetical protein
MRKSNGSAHVVVIIVIVAAIISLLGYLFYQNLTKTDTVSLLKSEHEEIIELSEGDYNKYVNYDENFELEIPKSTLGSSKCVSTNDGTELDNVPDPITVLSSDDDIYYITASHSAVITEKDTDTDEGIVITDCEEKVTTIDDFDEPAEGQETTSYVSTAYLEFIVTDASSLEDITEILMTKTAFRNFGNLGNGQWAVTDLGELTGERYEDMKVTWVGPKEDAPEVGGFAYDLWYYPEREKLVYFELGQSYPFGNGDISTDFQDTFKFTD